MVVGGCEQTGVGKNNSKIPEGFSESGLCVGVHVDLHAYVHVWCVCMYGRKKK